MVLKPETYREGVKKNRQLKIPSGNHTVIRAIKPIIAIAFGHVNIESAKCDWELAVHKNDLDYGILLHFWSYVIVCFLFFFFQ